MNDFISMMGWREETIRQIIYAVNFGLVNSVEEACFKYGLPWYDLLSSEQERILQAVK